MIRHGFGGNYVNGGRSEFPMMSRQCSDNVRAPPPPQLFPNQIIPAAAQNEEVTAAGAGKRKLPADSDVNLDLNLSLKTRDDGGGNDEKRAKGDDKYEDSTNLSLSLFPSSQNDDQTTVKKTTLDLTL
nr:two-component response regulator ARR18-like [Ipomoea batatas]